MSFSSTINILKLNDPETGISKKSGQPWERRTAECLLLTDSGQIDCVGKLTVPKDLWDSCKVGTYSAVFSLSVPTYGQDQGRIVATLVGLSPVTKSKQSLGA